MKFEEFQGSSGKWYIVNKTEVGKCGNQWWYPARRLGIAPADFVKMLVETYKVDSISFNNNILLYSWDSYSKAHSFVLWLNRELKKYN